MRWFPSPRTFQNRKLILIGEAVGQPPPFVKVRWGAHPRWLPSASKAENSQSWKMLPVCLRVFHLTTHLGWSWAAINGPISYHCFVVAGALVKSGLDSLVVGLTEWVQ